MIGKPTIMIAIIIVLFLLVGGVLGQPVYDLDLEKIIDLAVAHSYQIKAAASQAEASQKAISVARAERFPTLTATATSFYTSDITILDVGGFVGQDLLVEFGNKETYEMKVGLSVPLFTGGRISGAIDLAGAAVAYHRAQLEATTEQVIYIARKEYLLLARADRLLEAARASLDRTEMISEEVSTLFTAGVADSLDLLEASLALTRAQFSVKLAASDRTSISIRLKTLLGLDPAGQIQTLKPLPDPPSASAALPERKFAVSYASPHKPELLAAGEAVRIAEARSRLVHSDYFPTLAAFGGYTYGKPNLDPLNKTWNDHFTIGATLTWSFNLGGRTGSNIGRAEAMLQSVSYEKERLEDELNRAAGLSHEAMALAVEKYDAAHTNFKITSDNYRLATIKHREGDLSANRLVQIETALAEAEATLAAALVDFYLARNAAFYTIGMDRLKKGLL